MGETFPEAFLVLGPPSGAAEGGEKISERGDTRKAAAGRGELSAATEELLDAEANADADAEELREREE